MNELLTVTEEKITCNDCGRWEYRSSARLIKHSSRCDTPQAQFVAPAATSAAKEVSPYTLQAGEDVYDRDFRLQKGKFISQSDAMNTDY